MESMNRNTMSFGAYHSEQALAHGMYAGIGKRETENIGCLGIGIEQDITNSDREQLRFTGSGTSDNEDGAFHPVNGSALFRIQRLKVFAEQLVSFLQIGHCLSCSEFAANPVPLSFGGAFTR
jgi:hypothetical protein